MEVESPLKTVKKPINDSPLQTSETPSHLPFIISSKSSKASTKKIPLTTTIRKGIIVKANSQSSPLHNLLNLLLVWKKNARRGGLFVRVNKEVDSDKGSPSDSEYDDYSLLETYNEEEDDDDGCIDDELNDDGNLEYVDDSCEPLEDPLWGNHIAENDNESNYIQRFFQNGVMYVDRGWSNINLAPWKIFNI